MANEERLVVKPYNPARERQRLLLAIGLVLASLILGLLLGAQYFESAMVEKRELQEHLAQLELEQEQLRQQLTTAELAVSVDRDALEAVRLQLSDLRGQLADSEQELGFYRNLLQQEGVAQGLMISGFTIDTTERGFSYRLVVQQRAGKLKTIKVRSKVEVAGLLAGEPTKLGLAALDAEQDKDVMEMKFRYFYVHDGELVFPEGFEPSMVHVKAWIAGQAKRAVERQFEWSVEQNLESDKEVNR